MPSSISSSEWRVEPPSVLVPFDRPLPVLRFAMATIVAILVFVGSIAGWELYWRAYGATPSYQNSDGLWALQRRRIDHGEGHKTVIIGSSRVLFDVQLPVYERMMGDRPIQLAFEGTSPVPFLEDLANDPKFTGRVLVGVTPVLFFSAFDRRLAALKYFRDETPSQRAGQWLSMHILEPLFAFYDEDFALMTVLRRQNWPARPGVLNLRDVRKLSDSEADRNTQMWSKVESDPEYQQLTRDIWRDLLTLRPRPKPEESIKIREEQIERAIAAVAKLRARGVQVMFVRAPSNGLWREIEQRAFPRAENWDVLLKRTGAPGIHFEDYPELQGLTLPEWSHLSAADAERFTEALCRILESEYGWSRRDAKKEN